MHQGKSEYNRNFKWRDSFRSESFQPSVQQVAPPAGCCSVELGTLIQYSVLSVVEAWCSCTLVLCIMYSLIYFSFLLASFCIHIILPWKLWCFTKSCWLIKRMMLQFIWHKKYDEFQCVINMLRNNSIFNSFEDCSMF